MRRRALLLFVTAMFVAAVASAQVPPPAPQPAPQQLPPSPSPAAPSTTPQSQPSVTIPLSPPPATPPAPQPATTSATPPPEAPVDPTAKVETTSHPASGEAAPVLATPPSPKPKPPKAKPKPKPIELSDDTLDNAQPASGKPPSFRCFVRDVMAFYDRTHVRCYNKARGKFMFFAVDTGQPIAATVLAKALNAIQLGKPVTITYAPSRDLNPSNCDRTNCRRLLDIKN
mgnify:CR=1 FL=1